MKEATIDLKDMSDDQWHAHLHANCTFVYDCTANALCGFDCTLLVGGPTAVDFPKVFTPPPPAGAPA